MRYYLDRDTGRMLPVPGYIDPCTGMMVQRFEPRAGEILCDGRAVSRFEFPLLWDLFSEQGVLRQCSEDTFFLPCVC